MNGHIKLVIGNCAPCREHLPSQGSKPTGELLTASASMKSLSMDLFYTGGCHYLATIDWFLVYLWIFPLT